MAHARSHVAVAAWMPPSLSAQTTTHARLHMPHVPTCPRAHTPTYTHVRMSRCPPAHMPTHMHTCTHAHMHMPSPPMPMHTCTCPRPQLNWPEFHNGAAAALRLCPPGCGPSDEGELGRNWIVYNKPRSRQHSHAGFLLGLGLNGHLLTLANTDLYRCMARGACACT